MRLPKKILILFAVIGLSVSIACSIMSINLPSSSEHFSNIRFCQDVTDDGECIGETSIFSSGTTTIWALFTYKNMTNGDIWSRVWKNDGEIYYKTQNEEWEDDKEGWAAYSLEDPNGLEGEFTLSLFLGKKEIVSNSCNVEKRQASPKDDPSFGPIILAQDVTEDNFPIGATTLFDPGTKRVYGIFTYSKLLYGQSYTVEWLINDIEASRVESEWENSGDGTYEVSLYDDEPLPAGDYVLNLYIGDHLARSAIFQILAENQQNEPEPVVEEAPNHPDRSAAPEEVVDAAALPYYNMIANSDLEVLREILRINLENWTRVVVSDDVPCSEDAIACFSYSCDKRSEGTVYIRQQSIDNEPDYRVAEYMTHELTHGMEHYLGMKCGCTVEKEYNAMVAEIDFLLWSGYEDYAYENYGKLWDDNGQVQKDLLWNVVKDIYYSDTCPEY